MADRAPDPLMQINAHGTTIVNQIEI